MAIEESIKVQRQPVVMVVVRVLEKPFSGGVVYGSNISAIMNVFCISTAYHDPTIYYWYDVIPF